MLARSVLALRPEDVDMIASRDPRRFGETVKILVEIAKKVTAETDHKITPLIKR
jgi:hypothetical protein